MDAADSRIDGSLMQARSKPASWLHIPYHPALRFAALSKIARNHNNRCTELAKIDDFYKRLTVGIGFRLAAPSLEMRLCHEVDRAVDGG